MTETRYYHLTMKSLEQALPQLLSKTLGRGWRAVVMVSDEARVEALNTLLWTYNDAAFLPHGSAKDGEGPHQPVWLTMEDENPNGASVLFLCDGRNSDKLEDYDLVCRLFDGNDEEALKAARSSWKTQKDAGHKLTYWQQSDSGAWQMKAEANQE